MSLDPTDWHAELDRLEFRLFAAWVRGPRFRTTWTPDPSLMRSPRHRALAAACLTLSKLDTTGDLGVALVAQLHESGELARHWQLGDSPLEVVPAAIDPDADLARWRELRCSFALRQSLQETLSWMTPARDLSEVRTRILEATSKASVAGPAKLYSDGELMVLAYTSMTRQDRTGCYSGHVEIDRATGGVRPGHMWVLGAPTNWGKSSWLLSVADHYLSVHSQGVLYVTCEDAPELLATRLMCRRAEIRGRAARDAKLSRAEMEAGVEQMATAGARGSEPVMLDGRGRPVETLADDIRGAVAQHKIRVVLVDYLQCISALRQTQDRRAEINHIARTLTDAIKTSGAGGIMASQLTGEDIRESRDVEHAAEVVLIGRKDADSGALSLFMKKNKTGASGLEMRLDWNPVTGSFRTKLEEDEYGINWDTIADAAS